MIAAAAVLQSDFWTPPQPRIYALADNTAAGSGPTLWMLCLADVLAGAMTGSAWSQWIPLGAGYDSLAGGPSLAATDTLFVTTSSTAGSLAVLRQNPMTGKWTDAEVKRPSQAAEEIVTLPMYKAEATFTDSNGIAAADAPVTVFAESPVDGWINNQLYPLDPVRGTTVKTDKLGRLRVKTRAEGLHAPTLTFSSPGLSAASAASVQGGAGIVVSPSQNVAEFLKGTGTLRVNGGGPATLTGNLLHTQYNNLNPKVASSAVETIKNIAKIPIGSASPLAPDLIPLNQGSTLDAGLPGSIFGHLWHDIKHAADAVVHAIKSGVLTATVDLEKDTVKLTIQIGDDLVGTFDLVIHTIGDALRAIEIFVKSVIAKIEEFIEFLMLLFDWEKIRATQRAIERQVYQGIAKLQQSIGTAQQQVKNTFSTIESEIKKGFSSIASGVLGDTYTTFGSLPATWSSSSSGALLRAGTSSTAAATPSPIPGGSSAYHNSFLDKILDNIIPSFSLGAIPGLDISNFLDELQFAGYDPAASNRGSGPVEFCRGHLCASGPAEDQGNRRPDRSGGEPCPCGGEFDREPRRGVAGTWADRGGWACGSSAGIGRHTADQHAVRADHRSGYEPDQYLRPRLRGADVPSFGTCVRTSTGV